MTLQVYNSGMVKTRFYKKSDYPQVKAILQEANLFDKVWDGEENLAGMIDNDKQSILVAEVNNKITGNIFITPYGPKVAYLFRLAVKQEFRQQGVATKLLTEAETICKKRGVKEIALFADKDNQFLNDFYYKRNYKTSSVLHAYYCFWKQL